MQLLKQLPEANSNDLASIAAGACACWEICAVLLFMLKLLHSSHLGGLACL